MEEPTPEGIGVKEGAVDMPEEDTADLFPENCGRNPADRPESIVVESVLAKDLLPPGTSGAVLGSGLEKDVPLFPGMPAWFLSEELGLRITMGPGAPPWFLAVALAKGLACDRTGGGVETLLFTVAAP